MSTHSRTICDLCGLEQSTDYSKQKGWAYARVTGPNEKSRDFCPDCWRPVEKILLRNFVDGLMMQVQGVKEDTE